MKILTVEHVKAYTDQIVVRQEELKVAISKWNEAKQCAVEAGCEITTDSDRRWSSIFYVKEVSYSPVVAFEIKES